MKKNLITLTVILITSQFKSEAQLQLNTFTQDQHNSWQASPKKAEATKKALILKTEVRAHQEKAIKLRSKAIISADSANFYNDSLRQFTLKLNSLNDGKTNNNLIKSVADKFAQQAAMDDENATVAEDKASSKTNALKTAEKKASDYSGYVFGGGTATSLEKPTPNPSVNLGVAFTCRRNTFMLAFNQKAATTVDSLNRQKSFLFPEISSRGFVFEYSTALGKNMNKKKNIEKAEKKKNDKETAKADSPATASETEQTDCVGCKISKNLFVNVSAGYIKDTANHLITPYNAMVGCRFSYNIDLSASADSTAKKLKNLSISLVPYLSASTIDPKEFGTYETMFNKNKTGTLQTTVTAAGAKFEIEIGSLNVFFSYKYMLGATATNVFNNSYWTIGTSVNTTIFSF